MDLYNIINETQIQTPTNNMFQNKGGSPSKQRRVSNVSTIESQTYQSNTSSQVHFQVPTPENDSFRVYVRVRPLSTKELASADLKTRQNIVKVEDNIVSILSPYTNTELTRPDKTYVFNRIFNQDIKTSKLYDEALSVVVENIINGYNSTVLAYGMTGAGKTFTMFGDIFNQKGDSSMHPGVISLMVRDLFLSFEKEAEKGFDFCIKLSYLEIYNEHVRDLLTPSNEDLMIIEDSDKGIAIPNLSEFSISSHEDIVKLILQGNSRRVMASTQGNEFSSRSHAIIQLLVEKKQKVKGIANSSILQSKICLVDLAGSERAAISESKGLRHREGANINKSLLALGNCINILSDPHKKGAFVPYRDSKLTRLLKESLGGNTQTIMLACVSPSCNAYEETVNTLKYASRARKIQRKVVQNVREAELNVEEYKRIIESLQGEVSLLKHKLHQKSDQSIEVYRPRMTADFTSKVNQMLDELGKRLVALFEENWEYTQSYNELKDLKSQNEETLKNKLQMLGRTIGGSQLYNRLSDEVAALKEVMSNNERIEKEMEENIERSEQEKKMVQSQILGMISQTFQSVDSSQKDLCLDEIARSSPILNSESPSTRKMLSSQQDETFGRKTEKESKIMELLGEVEEMKKKLAEKDKMLAQNQRIIQTFLNVNSKEPLRHLSPKYIHNCSPVKERSMINVTHNSTKWLELSHQEQDLQIANNAFMINRVPTTAQMTSMAKINCHYGFSSPKNSEPISAALFQHSESGLSFTKATEVTKATYYNEQIEQKSQTTTASRGNIFPKKIEDNTLNTNSDINKTAQKSGNAYFSLDPEPKSTQGHVRNFTAHFGTGNSENIQKTVPETKKPQQQHVQPSQNKVSIFEETGSFGLPGSTRNSATQKYHHKSLSTSVPFSFESFKPTESQKMLRSPQNQVHQQQMKLLQPSEGDESSPNISSIIPHPQEFGGDSSLKDLLITNFNNASNSEKPRKMAIKTKSSKIDKENLFKREISPKSATASSLMQSHKLGFNRSPTSVKLNTAIKVKSLGVSTPETFDAKVLRPLSGLNSPSCFANQVKSLCSSPDNKPLVLRSPSKETFSSLSIHQRQNSQKMNRVSPGKKSVVDSGMKTSASMKDRNMREYKGSSQTGSPSLKLIPNFMSSKENNDKKSKYMETGKAKGETGEREILRGFQAKLYQLANLVEYNKVQERDIREMNLLMDEYKLNRQTYQLSTEDLNALKKVESVLNRQPTQRSAKKDLTTNGFESSDGLKTKESARTISANTSIFYEGDKPFGSLPKYEKNFDSTKFSRKVKTGMRAFSADTGDSFGAETSRSDKKLGDNQNHNKNLILEDSESGGSLTHRAKEAERVEPATRIRTQNSQITQNFKLLRDARK